MMLEHKVAIVTGGASRRGMGFATAKALAAQGAMVAIVDRREDEAMAAAVSIGPAHRGYGCDVADAGQCAQVADRIAAEFGGIDALLTFAGISRSTPLLEMTVEEYRAVIDINLGGTMHMCRAVVPSMIARRGGVIVCIGSLAGQRGGGVFGSAHYSASKGGVHSLAKALARELGPSNIRVNAIAPGLIETDIFEGKLTEEIRQNVLRSVPLGRLGQPVDVASVAVFLASDWSSYITGSVIDVNGGLHIH